MWKFEIESLERGELRIPSVVSVDFANDLCSSIGTAYDFFYGRQVGVFYDDVTFHAGAGAFRMSGHRRVCRACERPILRGENAWFVFVDYKDKRPVVVAVDMAHKAKERNYCCPRGETYNQLRNEFIKRNVYRVRDALAYSAKAEKGVSIESEFDYRK